MNAMLRLLQEIRVTLIQIRFKWTGYTKGEQMPPEYRYFKPEEIAGLDEEFVAKLDQARYLAGFPFIITSGLRTPETNQSLIGAAPESSHLKGFAVDIHVGNSHEVFLLVHAARVVGITRIGVYVDKEFNPVHVHLDVDPDKVPEVLFIKQEMN